MKQKTFSDTSVISSSFSGYTKCNCMYQVNVGKKRAAKLQDELSVLF